MSQHKNFASTILKYRIVIIIAFAVAVFVGIHSWITIPIDAFPDVTNIQVTVITKTEGLSAEDVESQISYVAEQKLRGLPKVNEVRSLSKSGISQVVVIFEENTDIFWARQIVFEKLSEVKESLPEGVEPELGPISTGLGEIFQYTLESDSKSLTELRTIQDWLVAPLLKPVKGVNEVNSFGGYVKQYLVTLNPDLLIKHGLSAGEVIEKIEKSNGNGSGGVIVNGWEQKYLRGLGYFKDIKDIGLVVVDSEDGNPLYLSDIAEISISSEFRQGAVSKDGKGEVVAGMVIMLKDENSREVVDRVKETVEKIKTTLPSDVKLTAFYDRTSLIEACVETVTGALMQGGLLVILILFLFLAEIRTALVVLLSLPVTFFLTFTVMKYLGMSANLMSLGGLAFSVGMVVDASIVIVENIRRHFCGNQGAADRRTLTIKAVQEVASPVAFSAMIISIILLPLYSLQGIEGKMFIPLASTMLVAIVISLFTALTIVPVLSEIFLKNHQEKEFGFIKKLHSGYLNLLKKSMVKPQSVFVIAGLFVLTALALIPSIGTEFMPPLDEGAIAINVVKLPNASLDGSVKSAETMEKILMKFKEIETVISKTGRAEISEDPMGPEQTDLMIMLKPKKLWSSKTKQELTEEIAKELGKVPGIRLSFSQPIALRVNELISGIKSDVAVKIFGEDMTVLKTAADKIAAKMNEIKGATDVKVEQISGMEQLDIVIDRERAARFGLNVADINDAIEIAVKGKVATTFFEGEKRFSVAVRYPEIYRNEIEAVKRLLIRTPDGSSVQLEQVAQIKNVEAPNQISRENGMRRVVTECNVRSRDLGGFIKELKEAAGSVEKELPSGYFLTFGGQFENQERAMNQLMIVVPIAITLIILLLFMALRSVMSALLVLLNLPFALVGGIIAIAVFRMPLSVSAAVAFIVLLGIAVQNGVVLLSFYGELKNKMENINDIVLTGCSLRF
ncbi:MAG TPA: CusA/CzcA family heavy metal efflux RND transporter, partial [bacterium]|nr:CusA/CzcA family heavy metal efflux RND transporter [bacterium]